MTLSFHSLSLSACLLALSASFAAATADGPDYVQVTGVMTNDVLNMRSTPDAEGQILGTIPAETDGVLSFGCVGGLTLADWQDATEAERAAAERTRWCLVGYDQTIGWSAGWFLREGQAPDGTTSAERLTDLAGSDWQVREIDGTPPEAEAWIGFTEDGRAAGSSGCNRFTTGYRFDGARLAFEAVAMTRMACPPAESETEMAFMTALNASERAVGTALLLTLLDSDGKILVTLTPRTSE